MTDKMSPQPCLPLASISLQVTVNVLTTACTALHSRALLSALSSSTSPCPQALPSPDSSSMLPPQASALSVPSAWNVLPPGSTRFAPFPSSRFCSNVTLFKINMNALAHPFLSPALLFSIALITIWYTIGINLPLCLLSVFRD